MSRAYFMRGSGKGPVFEHLLTSTIKAMPDTISTSITSTKVTKVVEGIETLGITLHMLSDTTNDTYGYDETTESSFNLSAFFDCDIYNDTCQLGNITDSNTTSTTKDDHPEYSFWTLCLLLFPFFTVFGNILVVLSIYRERSLRHVTNYFICSLAVADLLVAVLVMPPAVYMEVTKYWNLSDELCDAWVAFDVLGCTASILNLVAISFDRYIAVTQPIKYAKHKNSKRVHAMLVFTWVVSIAIAAPIALGVNYSDARTPGACSFFNSDFLIYSSMGSFYIPSLMMIFLYWRIYRVLGQRARRSLANRKARTIDTQTLTNVIENKSVNEKPTDKTGLANMDNGKLSSYNTNTINNYSVKLNNRHAHETHIDEPSSSNATDSQEKDEAESDPKSPAYLPTEGELIVNPVAENIERQEQLLCETKDFNSLTIKLNETETNFISTGNKLIDEECAEDGSINSRNNCQGNGRRKKDKKNTTKFNFHMRTSRKRKEKSSSRRERKATKTLAIVLGVFLLCWWPFFTVNIMRAICLRYQLLNYPTCDIDPYLMGFFVWLGYINSFLNPVIYTIFNPEFRKAFKKILTDPMKKRY